MRPPTPTERTPDDQHRVRLALLLSHEHQLRQLAEAIDWTRFEAGLDAAGVEKLLTETLSTAKREQALRESELRRVNVDTTVREKAFAFPISPAASG